MTSVVDHGLVSVITSSCGNAMGVHNMVLATDISEGSWHFRTGLIALDTIGVTYVWPIRATRSRLLAQF